MARSIRWSLQFWYALVLAGVVGGFAVLLYYQVRSARLQEIDAELMSAANYLDSILRNFEPDDGPGGRPPPNAGFPGDDPPPKQKKEGFPPPRRVGPPRERQLFELTPPGWPREKTGSSDRYYIVWREDDSVIKSIDVPEGVTKPDEVGGYRGHPVLEWRQEYREALLLGPRRSVILVGRTVAPLDREMRTLAWKLGISGVSVLLVGLAGGWLFASRIVKPLARMTATASRISATNLSERIATEKIERELAELGQVLNGAFDRLESALARQVRFTADASHELRTPLAIVKSHAELALSRERSPEDYRQTLESCLKATDRMSAIVDGLLTLARADAGQLELRRESVDLREIVEESLRLLRPLAESRKLKLFADLQPVVVPGDPGTLAQLVRNLVNNAIQYNNPNGEVRIALKADDSEAILTVADTGIGIPASEHSHIFERFHRVDKARARSSGGVGLGLAICKTIVEGHGGSINFESSPAGTTFTVKFPLGEGDPWSAMG